MNAIKMYWEKKAMRKTGGAAKDGFFLRSRHGSVLPAAIVVMLLFMILCVGMLALSQMNVSHVVFFERRNILEQATLSLAQVLADEILENSEDWWKGAPNAEGKGELDVDSRMGPDFPNMKFTYQVTPGKVNSYLLHVRGEYANSSGEAIWGVSLDVYPETPGTLLVRWSKPVRLDG
jgi:hypothetical protein